jgi:hypothetical protein
MNTDIRKGFLKERTMKERKAYEKDFYPPIPTDFTMKMRTNLFWQFFRFIIINIKMIRMARFH